jgi:hypothetical protein
MAIGGTSATLRHTLIANTAAMDSGAVRQALDPNGDRGPTSQALASAVLTQRDERLTHSLDEVCEDEHGQKHRRLATREAHGPTQSTVAAEYQQKHCASKDRT